MSNVIPLREDAADSLMDSTRQALRLAGRKITGHILLITYENEEGVERIVSYRHYPRRHELIGILLAEIIEIANRVGEG